MSKWSDSPSLVDNEFHLGYRKVLRGLVVQDPMRFSRNQISTLFSKVLYVNNPLEVQTLKVQFGAFSKRFNAIKVPNIVYERREILTIGS